MGSKENRSSLLIQGSDQASNLPGTGHINPRCRFIEEKDLGAVNDSRGNGQFSFHPLRIGSKGLVPNLG